MRSCARPAHAIAGVVLSAMLLTGCSSQFDGDPYADNAKRAPVGIMVDASAVSYTHLTLPTNREV